jgi:hypothetical protein
MTSAGSKLNQQEQTYPFHSRCRTREPGTVSASGVRYHSVELPVSLSGPIEQSGNTTKVLSNVDEWAKTIDSGVPTLPVF